MKFIRDTKAIDDLLAKAPAVVDNYHYHAGHWNLMCALETEAKQFTAECSVDTFTRFLAKVSYLKQPDRKAYNTPEKIVPALKGSHREIAKCIEQIPQIDDIGYKFLDYISCIRHFGKTTGGRSFASAVGRLIRPDKFAIIDWRNLAVLSGCGEYAGLVDPAHHFRDLDCEVILKRKGSIRYSQELYIEYNNLVRLLALQEKKTPAEIDLILWAYSAEKAPFSKASKLSKPSPVTNSEPEQSSSLFFTHVSEPISRTPRHLVLNTIGILVGKYLDLLKNKKAQSIPEVGRELADIFRLVQREFHKYVRGQQRRKIQTLHVDTGLEDLIHDAENARAQQSIIAVLRSWVRWENMLKRDIDLPASMVENGYLVLEHFQDIRIYFAKQLGISPF